MRLRIGTRGSALARVQAADVAHRLHAHGHEAETIVISTEGDRVTDRAFADVGAFGIFVREIEVALLEGRIDVAVHSYKDLPSRTPDGLVVAAVPERLDAADMLLARPEVHDLDCDLLPLRPGALVGTSAARRRALVGAARPDLQLGMLRGNVPTRVRALIDGPFDAIVVAAAGLMRLERSTHGAPAIVPAHVVRTRLDPATFVPAPTQGAIAVQVRAEATRVREAVAAIDDKRIAPALRTERAALALAEGGCSLPFGAWCEAQPGGTLRLVAALGLGDGTIARANVTGYDPVALAEAVWRDLSCEVRA